MISSMTAFGKKQQTNDLGTVTWEIRSVNSRYLDVNFHMPEYLRELEIPLTQLLKKHVSRGKIDCKLHYQAVNSHSEDFIVNEALLKKLHQASNTVKTIFMGDNHIDLVDMLRWPGVIQTVRTEDKTTEKSILSLFEQTLEKFREARVREGKGLEKTILERLKLITKEIKKAEKSLPKTLKLQRQRFIDRFNEAQIKLDPERLEQEMLIIAQKMDIAEEIDRLKIHIQETKNLLKNETLVGRKLDFLMQEFNREANTLGSKSMTHETTQVAVELKVLIEQMREQIQNIE